MGPWVLVRPFLRSGSNLSFSRYARWNVSTREKIHSTLNAICTNGTSTTSTCPCPSSQQQLSAPSILHAGTLSGNISERQSTNLPGALFDHESDYTLTAGTTTASHQPSLPNLQENRSQEAIQLSSSTPSETRTITSKKKISISPPHVSRRFKEGTKGKPNRSNSIKGDFIPT